MKTVIRFALCLAILAPAPGFAQTEWEVPSLMRPGAPSGLTILVFSAEDRGDDLGILAAWRASDAPAGIGFRLGLSEADRRGPDPDDDDLSVIFGIDFSGTLASPSSTGSPGVLWWTGAGLGVGDDLLASFPLGISLGWVGSGDGVSFMPYVGGHIALDLFSGEGDDDLDLEGAIDLGMDLDFGSGFQIRFGAAVGGHDAFGIGVRFPT